MSKRARIAQLKRWCEEVMLLAGVDNLVDPPEGEAIVVDKDHGGAPGAVVIKARLKSGRTDFYKRGVKGWYVAATEFAQ